MLTEKEMILKSLLEMKGFRVDDVSELKEFEDARMVALGFSTISSIDFASDITFRVTCKMVTGNEKREALTHYDLVVPVIMGFEAVTTEATKTHTKLLCIADIMEEIDTGTPESVRVKRKEAIQEMSNVGFTISEIIEIIISTGSSRTTVKRMIKELRDSVNG